MSRLFIAINLSEKTKSEIENFIDSNSKLSEFKKIGRFIDRKNWHITLLFLGEKNKEEKNYIAENFSNNIVFNSPLEISLNQFGTINKRDYSMLWLKTSPESNQKLAIIQKKISQNLNISPDRGGFNGHITLMRFKKTLPPNIKIDNPIKINFQFQKIDLVESTLHPDGAKYAIVKSALIC